MKALYKNILYVYLIIAGVTMTNVAARSESIIKSRYLTKADLVNIPIKAQTYFKSALDKYQNKDYQKALSDLEQAIQIAPKWALPYSTRGALKNIFKKDYKGAMTDYNRAIQIDPKLSSAYSNRGTLKMMEFKDYQGALADFNRAIELDPNYANAYANRSTVKDVYLGDRAGATLDVQKAATLYRQQGNIKKYQDGMEILKNWRQQEGKNSSIH